ncbi:hypothetical protein Tco_0634947 [Tanacetum coccineum]
MATITFSTERVVIPHVYREDLSTFTSPSVTLETEEESSMALELIKFVKQQLEEFEDSNDDDLVTSDHGEEERV